MMKPGAVIEVGKALSCLQCAWNCLYFLFQMVEEDLYIPGHTMDITDIDSSSSMISSGSSEEFNQLPASSSFPRPSASLPDISAAFSGITTVRRSMSERRKERPLTIQTTPSAPPSSFPVQLAAPKPNNPRVFPRPKPSNSTLASHFKLHNLFPKLSNRDDGSETDGEQPRKTRKGSIIPASLIVGQFLLRPEVSLC